MAQADNSFETLRLRVVEWHGVEHTDGLSLPRIVQNLLTEVVTAPLPDAWHGPYSESRAQAWIRDRDAEGSTHLVVSQDSESVGLLLLYESEKSKSPGHELRVGYLIAEPHWGKGYATELLRGLVQWAESQSYGSIVAGVAADNAPSQRVLEKTGFVRVDDDDGEEWFYAIHF